jgi:hypothetical protein
MNFSGRPKNVDRFRAAEIGVDQNEQGALDGVESMEQQDEDEKDTHRHNDAQARHGTLLIFKLATPGDEVARGEGHIGLHALLHLGDQAAHIAPTDEDPNGQPFQHRHCWTNCQNVAP